MFDLFSAFFFKVCDSRIESQVVVVISPKIGLMQFSIRTYSELLMMHHLRYSFKNQNFDFYNFKTII